MNDTDSEKVINQRFQLQKQIGRGGFGTIFSAIDLEKNEEVAVKISRSKVLLSKWTSILTEHSIYQKLSEKKLPDGIVPPIDFFTEAHRHILVLPLLGKSLTDIFEHGKFSLQSICDIGCQVLTILEFIHGCGLVHLDIKPDNILFGRESEKIHLIDFGASKVYRDENGEQHPYKTGTPYVGTPTFSSLHIDFGAERSPRDDVESLFYCLIILSKGRLPWTNEMWAPVCSRAYVSKLKEHYRDALCDGFPEEFQQAWEIVADMIYYDEVDYDEIRRLLAKARGHTFRLLGK